MICILCHRVMVDHDGHPDGESDDVGVHLDCLLADGKLDPDVDGVVAAGVRVRQVPQVMPETADYKLYADASWDKRRYGLAVVIWQSGCITGVLVRHGQASKSGRGHESEAIQVARRWLGPRSGVVFNDCRWACDQGGARWVSRNDRRQALADSLANAMRLGSRGNQTLLDRFRDIMVEL